MRWRRPTQGNQRNRLIERRLERSTRPELAEVVKRNIDAIDEHRRAAEEARSKQERVADAITWFSGNLPFVYFHAVLFAVWILANLEIGGLPAFDPYPFGLLTTFVSLEAIFLSTFVLVSQNRQAAIAERRTELDLQINLLNEYEVTRVLALVDAIAERLGIEKSDDGELRELEKDIKPEAVLEELEVRANNKEHASKNGGRTNREPPSPDNRPDLQHNSHFVARPT
jgi:uncharacterized membrane protein